MIKKRTKQILRDILDLDFEMLMLRHPLMYVAIISSVNMHFDTLRRFFREGIWRRIEKKEHAK